MHKLQLRGHLLYLKGSKRTLSLAEAHNTRSIPIELEAFNHIDTSKTKLNCELVGLNGKSLENEVIRLIQGAGINPYSGRNKRSNKGFAIEWLFTVTPGFVCDFKDLYSRCLDWLRKLHPTAPIVHAVIHFDEADPHLHVITVPIDGNKLPASKMLGYKGVSQARLKGLYQTIASKYGLSPPVYLTGAAKKKASEIIIKVCEDGPYRKILGPLWEPVVLAIKARPEPFMNALKIPPDWYQAV